MDLIHTVTNAVDHNRGTVAGTAVLVASLVLGSCGAFDGKVISSTSGKLLDQDGLKGEYVENTIELQRQYDRGAELIRQGQAIIEQVERDSERLDASYVADAQLAATEIENRNATIGQAGQLVASATGIPWLLPLLTLGTSAAAAGAVYDNRRKDRVIRKTKTPES